MPTHSHYIWQFITGLASAGEGHEEGSKSVERGRKEKWHRDKWWRHVRCSENTAQTHANTYIYLYIYKYIYTYTLAHTYVYTYTYIQVY